MQQKVLTGGSASELPTEQMTADGRILGTVAYMSPEQTQGKNVDHRTDIFSAGVVLYEMATGQKPFSGDSPATILSSIIKDTPRSVTELNASVPRELGKIIRRGLAKDPDRRYQSAKDLRNELEELKQEVESGELLDGVPVRGQKRAPLAVIVVGAVLVTAIATYLLVGRGGDTGPGTTAPTVSGFTQLTSDPGIESFPSLSPDGRTVAYTRDGDIYLRRVGGERVLNLTEDSPVTDEQPETPHPRRRERCARPQSREAREVPFR